MVHTKIQQSLSKLQRRQLISTIIIGLITVGAIVGVGLKQASITEEIGLRQASIMEEQTTILTQQTEIQSQQYNYLSQEGLRVVDWKPGTSTIHIHWDNPRYITLYIENLGAGDVYITNIELIFEYMGESLGFSLSGLDKSFHDIKIEGHATEKIEIQVNPFAYESIKDLGLDYLLNQDLNVIIRIYAYEMMTPLEWSFTLVLVKEK